MNNAPHNKTQLVDNVFSSIFRRYDLMNDIISLGSHRIIKHNAMKQCKYGIGCNLLDLAAGTGDLSIIYRNIDNLQNKITLADPNSEMLIYAKSRLVNKSIYENVEFVTTYAEELPFEDNSFDNVSIGFGFRNFTDKVKSLSEIKRVLKKNGKLIMIDFSKPLNPIINRLNTLYLNYIVPTMANLITGNNAEYRYLAKSIAEHPAQETIITMMEDTGFTNCRYSNKLNGIISVHFGEK